MGRALAADKRTHLVEARIHFVMAVPRDGIVAVPCHVRAVLQGPERAVVAGGDRGRKDSGGGSVNVYVYVYVYV